MTSVYHGGSEIPGWRTLLQAEGVRHCAFSFFGLSRRVKFTRPWLLNVKFDPDTRILLDSGAYTLRKDPAKYDAAYLTGFADKYLTFIEHNADRLTLVTDLDTPALPGDERYRIRARLTELATDRFLPIWHADDGVHELLDLADRYGRVAVAQTDVRGRDIVPELRRLARSGIKLHGISMTKPEVMEALDWDSVASTSWLSPAQYGELTVWVSGELKRYPRKYADQARIRHRQLFDRNGFNHELIESGDATENLRVSLWSWLHYEKHLNQRKVVANGPERHDMSFAENDDEPVANGGTEGRQRIATARRRDTTTVMPGFGIREEPETYYDDAGNRRTRTLQLVTVSDESQRVCDTCFLRVSCQEYSPGSACAYRLPVNADNVTQVRRIRSMIMEIQTQRVAEGRAAEQQEGGYPDPNLTRELELLHKMTERFIEDEKEGFTLTVKANAKTTSQGSMFGAIFGKDAAAAAQALPAPVPADDVIRNMGIVDAEVIHDTDAA